MLDWLSLILGSEKALRGLVSFATGGSGYWSPIVVLSFASSFANASLRAWERVRLHDTQVPKTHTNEIRSEKRIQVTEL